MPSNSAPPCWTGSARQAAQSQRAALHMPARSMQDELRRKLREVEGVQSALDNEQRLTSELRKTAGEERQRYMQEAQARGAGLQGWRPHLLGFGVVQACALHSRCTLPLCWRNSTHRASSQLCAPQFPSALLPRPTSCHRSYATRWRQPSGRRPACSRGWTVSRRRCRRRGRSWTGSRCGRGVRGVEERSADLF